MDWVGWTAAWRHSGKDGKAVVHAPFLIAFSACVASGSRLKSLISDLPQTPYFPHPFGLSKPCTHAASPGLDGLSLNGWRWYLRNVANQAKRLAMRDRLTAPCER